MQPVSNVIVCLALSSSVQPNCWILIPGDNQTFIDGKPVPIISPSQKTKIRDQWLANIHRVGIGIANGREMEGIE